MIAPAPLRVARVVAALATCLAAAAGSWLLAGGPFRAVAGPLASHGPGVIGSLPFDVVLTGGCAAGLLACSAWVLGTSALVAVTHLATLVAPGSPALSACVRLAEAACPRIARGAVVGVLGLGLGAAVAGPALADASGTSPSGTTALDGLTVPDRATGLARPAPRVLQVRPGDSLWSIASRLLPRGADDARISEAWHTLHRVNRTRVGDDPDLIQPGTRLVVPDLTAPHREEHP